MKNDDFQLLVDISVDYYLKGMTQSEIAKARFISRPKVSRLLKRAKERGVVEIKINYDNSTFNKLQREVKRLFKVKNVHIVHTLPSEEETLEEVARLAAEKFSDIIDDNMTIGISWGTSVLTMVKFLERQNHENVSIVELFGTLHYNNEYNFITNSSMDMANKLGAKLYALPSPVYIENDQAREVLKNMPVVSDTLKKINDVDFVVTSIGRVSPNTKSTLWAKIIDDSVKEEVVRKEGVGFILAHFFDINGQLLDLKYNKEIIGISSSQMQRKPVFLVCSGSKKAEALYAALKGRMVDTLICDEALVKKMLEYNDLHYDMKL